MEDKIKALLDGLECQNIDEMMGKFKTAKDYRRFGTVYAMRVKQKLKQARLEALRECAKIANKYIALPPVQAEIDNLITQTENET